MTTRRTVLALLCLCLATSAAAAEEAPPTLAVLDFATKGGVSQDAADALADLVASEALRHGTHKVIGKADIKSLIGYEQIKDSLGCEEADCLAEIGGALGVDLILVGNVSQFAEVFLLNLRLIDPRKAEVTARVSRKVPGGQAALLDAVQPAVRELLGAEPVAVFGVVGGLGLSGGPDPAGPAPTASSTTAPGTTNLAAPAAPLPSGDPLINRPTDLVELEEIFEVDLGAFYAQWLTSAQRRRGLDFDGYMLEAAHVQAADSIGWLVAGCGLILTAAGLVPVVVIYDDGVTVGLVGAGIIVSGLLGIISLPMGAMGYVNSQDAIEKLTPRVKQARTGLGPRSERPRTWSLGYRFSF